MQTGTCSSEGGMNLCSQGLFLITAVHQSLVGLRTHRKEQNAPADDKAGRTSGSLVSFSLKINLVFLNCICVIRHNEHKGTV